MAKKLKSFILDYDDLTFLLKQMYRSTTKIKNRYIEINSISHNSIYTSYVLLNPFIFLPAQRVY